MIAILTPTRGRPERFAEMVEETCATAEGVVRIYCGLDDDDPGRRRYIDDERVHTIIVGPRKRLAGWTNDLAALAIGDGADILAFFGDDHRPRTRGWDRHVHAAFDRMGAGLVYCADGLQNERLPTAPFWSASVIKTLGWFFPPVLKHMFADDYWLRLANDLDRRVYLPDVLIEHMHPSAGKAEMDDVYRTNDTHIDADRQAFQRFIVEKHPAILERVRCAL